MKKIIIIILIGLFCITGCINQDKEAITKDFIDKEWIRYNNDTEHLIFDSEGKFHYWCDCGNPVYDSDICETYKYNKKTQKITLKCYKSKSRTLEVIKVTDDTLKIDFNGSIRTFKLAKEEQKN